jgi:hypothetical protein
VRSLVVVTAGAALDVLFLSEKALQLGVHLDDRTVLVDRVGGEVGCEFG